MFKCSLSRKYLNSDLTEQMAAGDSLLSQGGLHGGDG